MQKTVTTTTVTNGTGKVTEKTVTVVEITGSIAVQTDTKKAPQGRH